MACATLARLDDRGMLPRCTTEGYLVARCKEHSHTGHAEPYARSAPESGTSWQKNKWIQCGVNGIHHERNLAGALLVEGGRGKDVKSRLEAGGIQIGG